MRYKFSSHMSNQDTNLAPILNYHQILLVNPPIYDYRLEWSRWHQPTGLLQLASLMKLYGKELRIIDCLHNDKKQLPRHKIDTLSIEDYKVNKWHYGLSFNELETQIKTLQANNWQPDVVFVTSLNSIWWEAVRDTIIHLKNVLPKTSVILGGVYPTVAFDHAVQYSEADEVIQGSIVEAANLSPDLLVYEKSTCSTGIYFYGSRTVHDSPNAVETRSVNKTVEEIIAKAEIGVREFVFFDEEIYAEDVETFGILLDEITKADIQAHFVLPGNIAPDTITRDLAQKMQQARLDRVYLRCKINFGQDSIQYASSLADYQNCAELLLESGGFKSREENIAAMLVVGLPYEDLEVASERLIRLAHIVGSVILVPFQYVPGLHKGTIFDRVLAQDGHFSPEKFNSKLYPLARLSGKTFGEYIELTRLARLLNSKYRSKTFDFLGDSLAAKLFRETIRTEGWNPFKDETERKDTEEGITLKSR